MSIANGNDQEISMSNYVRCIDNTGYQVSLTVGAVYKVLPADDPQESDLRIIDNTGEDYFFSPSRFEPVKLGVGPIDATATVHLPGWMHGVLQAEAIAADKTVSALLRELIAERFDLPEAA